MSATKDTTLIKNTLQLENIGLLEESFKDNLKSMSPQDLQKAYDCMLRSIDKLNPTSDQHVAPIPYGVAYSRAKGFDLMCVKVKSETAEPEELLAYLADPTFLTKKYKGPLKALNNELIMQYVKNIKDTIDPASGLPSRALAFMKCKDFVLTAALCKAWERYQYVFTPDEEFASHLMSSDDFEFMPEVFKYLPTESFFLDFKNISDTPVRGAFVTIDSDNDFVYVYTSFIEDDYAKDDVGFMLGRGDLCQHTISILPKNKLLKFSEWLLYPGVAYQVVPAKHFFQRPSIIVNTRDRDNGTTIRMLTLKLLMYLASSCPDLEMDKYWKRQKSRLERTHKNTSNIPEEWTVGARYGEIIRQNRRKSNNKESVESAPTTHKSPKAHIRSAHFHLYWTGENRKIPELKFLSPITVNGSNIVPVIHRLTDVEPKGSFGEELIKDELIKNGYEFKRERYVREIKKRFDFEVVHNGQVYMIEFDGEQHFKPVPNWGGKAGYEKRRQSDELKNAYCIENDIPLLRIRFDQKPEIPEIIKEFISSASIGEWNSRLSNEDYYSICL